MTPFRYRAARADGGIVEGLVDAGSAAQASATVTDRGLFPLTVTPAEPVATARRPARGRQALAYPLLLAVVGIASILVIGTVIVPRFAELLGDLGQELPPATRVLLVGSRVLSQYWFLLVPAAAGLVALGVEVGSRPG